MKNPHQPWAGQAGTEKTNSCPELTSSTAAATTAPPVPRFDFDDALLQLQILSLDPSDPTVRLRAIPWLKFPKDPVTHQRVTDESGKLLSGPQIEKAPASWLFPPVPHRWFRARLAQGYRFYLCPNPGGDRKADITTCRVLFAEWDDRPIDWQIDAWRELGLPQPTLIVTTGGKSAHCFWKLKEPIPADQWVDLMKRLAHHAGSDPNICDPSRVMGLAGAPYFRKQSKVDQPPHPDEGHCIGVAQIVEGDPDRTYDTTAFDFLPPALAAPPRLPRHQQAGTYGVTPGSCAEDFPPRCLEEIREALDRIPPAIANNGEYTYWRDLTAGLEVAVLEAGGTAQQALDFITEHSPQFAEAPDQVGRWKHSISAGSFWSKAKEAGHSFWVYRKPTGYTRPTGGGVSGSQVVAHGDELPPPLTPERRAEIDAKLEALQQQEGAHFAAAPEVASLDDEIEASTARWPGDAAEVEALIQRVALVIHADFGEQRLRLRDLLHAKTRTPKKHLDARIDAALQAAEAERSRIRTARDALIAERDAELIAAEQRQSQAEAAAQAQDSADAIAAAAGGQALLLAVGDGWQMTDDGPKPKTLHVGELHDALRDGLGSRLAFDELHLLPAMDGHPLPPDEVELAHVDLNRQGWIIGKELVVDAVAAASRKVRFHPIRDYLTRVAEAPDLDPIDLNTFGADYFGVTDPLQQTFLRKMLLGAVHRAMKPGCDFKNCTVLLGEQTYFKSLALRSLCGAEWFCDSTFDGSRDHLMQAHGSWIYELAELESITSRKEAGAIKAVLSTTTDKFRAPYERGVGTFPRGFIFVGSTNKDDFLVDDTGNTRFWLVSITQVLDFKRIAADRDRIWKAAMLAFRAGELPYLDRETMARSEERNQVFIAEHPWAQDVARWVKGYTDLIRGFAQAPAMFSTSEALEGSWVLKNAVATTHHSRQMAAVLKGMGFVQDKHQTRGHGSPNGSRLWRWAGEGARGAAPSTSDASDAGGGSEAHLRRPSSQ